MEIELANTMIDTSELLAQALSNMAYMLKHDTNYHDAEYIDIFVELSRLHRRYDNCMLRLYYGIESSSGAPAAQQPAKRIK